MRKIAIVPALLLLAACAGYVNTDPYYLAQQQQTNAALLNAYAITSAMAQPYTLAPAPSFGINCMQAGAVWRCQ